MGNIKNEIGNLYGRLIVTEYKGLNKSNQAMWVCQCSCGEKVTVIGKLLRNGSTKSCGCLKHDVIIKKNYKHGCTHTGLYSSWRAMKERCNSINGKNYENYGGRGIFVTQEWNKSFENFKNWALQSGYSEGLTIERLDVNEGYCPSNCTWIPLSEQGINKRSTKWVTVNEITKTMSDWARFIGISVGTLFSNERNGVEIEKYIMWKLDHKGLRYPRHDRRAPQ